MVYGFKKQMIIVPIVQICGGSKEEFLPMGVLLPSGLSCL